MSTVRIAASISTQGAKARSAAISLPLIEHVIQQSNPQVGLTQIVDVRKNQGHMSLHALPGFDHLVEFSAHIPAGFGYRGQNALNSAVEEIPVLKIALLQQPLVGTAVNRQHHAGDIGGCWGEQESRHAQILQALPCALAALRHFLPGFLLQCWCCCVLPDLPSTARPARSASRRAGSS
jgi:hypothetical protein